MMFPLASLMGDTVKCQSTAVLVPPNRLIVFDAFAAPDALKDTRLLIVALRRNEEGDRFADHLFSRVAKEPLRGLVPAGNEAVEVFTDDCVFGRLDDGGQPLAGRSACFKSVTSSKTLIAPQRRPLISYNGSMSTLRMILEPSGVRS